MPAPRTENILDIFDYIVREGRENRGARIVDASMANALAAAVNWLAERVPYKVPLPRGYTVLWKARSDLDGQVRRYHQLLKPASLKTGVKGVWIDCATLEEIECADVRIFAADLESGWLQEIIAFLQQTSASS